MKKLNLKAKIRAMAQLKNKLPRQLGNQALNHFRQSFRDGGFTDSTLEPWQLPKRKQKNEKGTRYLYSGRASWDQAGKYTGFTRADRTRATLVQSGALRSSIRVLRTAPGQIVIGSDLKYAKVHNTGGKTKNGGKMPKRQFVGDSRNLNAGMKKKVSGEILKALKI